MSRPTTTDPDPPTSATSTSWTTSTNPRARGEAGADDAADEPEEEPPGLWLSYQSIEINEMAQAADRLGLDVDVPRVEVRPKPDPTSPGRASDEFGAPHRSDP